MESRFRRLGFHGRCGRCAVALARSVFPHRCVGCGAEGLRLCGECRTEMSAGLTGILFCPGCGVAVQAGGACVDCRGGAVLSGAWAVGRYADPRLRQLLHDWKYEGVAESGEAILGIWRSFLGRHRAALVSAMGEAVVVPVPLHWFRLARRGFNQAAELARVVAEELGLSYGGGRMRRRWRWRSQVCIGADADERSRNVSGAFVALSGYVWPDTVVLVDDVFTTGATLSAVAHELKKFGVKKVWVLTLLRG